MKKTAKTITPISKFEATMIACQKSKAKALKESAAKKTASNKKRAIKKTNKKVESAIRRQKRMFEEEEYDPEVDDADLPEDTVDDAVIVVDPELDTGEYESSLDDLQAIIDETPEGEVPSTDEYVNDYVYTCPICGNNFFSDTEMGEDEECPVCGEVVDDFILAGGVESPDEALGDESDEETFDDEDIDSDLEDDSDDMGDEDLDVVEEDEDLDVDMDDTATESKKRSRKSCCKESYKYLLDEKTINPMLTKFIRENYKNASSMRVVGAKISGRKIRMECVIRFKSGSTKKSFITLENFRPTAKSTQFKAKVDSAFKVESKKSAPFVFEAYTARNVIKFTKMNYSFVTKKEGKRLQVFGKYALKENRSNFRKGTRK